jgi:outer membrane protein insertion porin family
LLLSGTRAALLAIFCLFSVSVVSSAQEPSGAPQLSQVQGGTIAAIRVEGNQRIESGTIRSYMLVRPGDPFDPSALDRSLKTLYASGLFSDVSLRRDGSTLVVHVAENPLVNSVVFEGNHKLTEDKLAAAVSLKSRSVFTPAAAEADRQRILNLYAMNERYATTVVPKIIKRSLNRVDVVFEINDGDATLISRIIFVGNQAFSESRLDDVVDSRESAWWRFLSSSDSYNPERINFDKELLRRFYLQKGYADFSVTSATAELTPDKSSFFLTYTLHEGARYTIAKTDLNVSLPNVDKASLVKLEELSPGDWYDGDAVDRTVIAMTQYLQSHGFAFAVVQPRVQRNTVKHTIDLAFDVTDGPHVYVERIDIVGNERTEDKVIRREMRLAEGDPFNAELLRQSRQRLQDLNYFNTVGITSGPGSTPDRTDVNVNVEEKATGELTIGGGYSTDIGALLDLGISEKNIIGTGMDAGFNAILAQKETQLTISASNPYFLDRNLLAGFQIFHTVQNNQTIAEYNERRDGFEVTLGYEFTDHLRQTWSYALVQRDIYDAATTASIYVLDEQGTSLLSQISQQISLDYRDSKLEPHAGWLIRLGTDFAGAGGTSRYIRAKIDGNYYIPLDRFTGDSDWGIAVSAGAGYLFTMGAAGQIIDRFFLGGDNLRGFQDAGAGPHAINVGGVNDSIGGNFIWTQSTELRFPLPVSPDIGISGRLFVDVGALSEVRPLLVAGVPSPLTDNPTPRISTGVGISWKTPVGLLNIDLGVPLKKEPYDETQFFRFGFGTRF